MSFQFRKDKVDFTAQSLLLIRFLVNFLISPLVFCLIAYLSFDQFIKLGFFADDIDFLGILQDLAEAQQSLFNFIPSCAMRGQSFKPLSLGINWVINFKLFDLNAYNYHLFNIFILGINSFLLYFLIWKSFKLRFLGCIIAFYYLVHPFNIEGMAWISAGFTSQNVVLFSCLTLITYYLFLKKSKIVYLIISYILFGCAFLSREDTIMLPFVMVFFLLFYASWQKVRIKEITGYLVVAFLILVMRYLLLRSRSFEVYKYDFTNIANALAVNKYYLDLAFSPLKRIFNQSVFLQNCKIPLVLFRSTFYLFFVPFFLHKLYRHRKTYEVKLLGFGLAWYCLLCLPFNFMSADISMTYRYLSLSIIGILMVKVSLIALSLKFILRNNIYIKIVLVGFTVILLFTCRYMVIEGFNNILFDSPNLKNQPYIAAINHEIKNNPSLKNIKLVGFPGVERFASWLHLCPEYKNINFINLEKEDTTGEDGVFSLTITYKDS